MNPINKWKQWRQTRRIMRDQIVKRQGYDWAMSQYRAGNLTMQGGTAIIKRARNTGGLSLHDHGFQSAMREIEARENSKPRRRMRNG